MVAPMLLASAATWGSNAPSLAGASVDKITSSFPAPPRHCPRLPSSALVRPSKRGLRCVTPAEGGNPVDRVERRLAACGEIVLVGEGQDHGSRFGVRDVLEAD